MNKYEKDTQKKKPVAAKDNARNEVDRCLVDSQVKS